MTMTNESEALTSRTAVEQAVAGIEPGVSVDTIAEARTKAYAIKKWISDLCKELDERCVKIIQATGEIRYAVGDHGEEIVLTTSPERSVKCRDIRKAFQTLAGMDLDVAVDCLSANALKHGAVKKALIAQGTPKLFNELFVTETKHKLEESEPKLRVIDTTYSK